MVHEIANMYSVFYYMLKLGSISQKINVHFAISAIVFEHTTSCNFNEVFAELPHVLLQFRKDDHHPFFY
jgi:hypothetical protein